MPTRGHNQGIVALAQLSEFGGVHLAVGNKAHAHILNALELLAQQIVVQTGAGDDLLQLAAHDAVGLVHGHVVAHAGQLPGCCEAAHPAADDAHMFARAFGGFGHPDIGRAGPQLADLHGAV